MRKSGREEKREREKEGRRDSVSTRIVFHGECVVCAHASENKYDAAAK